MTEPEHLGALRGSHPAPHEKRVLSDALCNTYICDQTRKKNHMSHLLEDPLTHMHTHTQTNTLFCPMPFFQGFGSLPASFWLFLFQQSQLITPYCCRQLQTTTNLEFHYSKLFHMCIQGPGRLGWPRFRKELQPIGTHPHPANTACHLSLFFFLFLLCLALSILLSRRKYYRNPLSYFLCDHFPFTTASMTLCVRSTVWINPQKNHRRFHNATKRTRGRDGKKLELVIWTCMFQSVCLACVWPLWISPS